MKKFKLGKTLISIIIIIIIGSIIGFSCWSKHITLSKIEACKSNEYCVAMIKSIPPSVIRCLEDEACIRVILTEPTENEEKGDE